jgi:hypothetical protein
MSEQFRDVSPEDAELQPIIEGLFGEYAARYGDYFSKDAEVELTEWYLAPQGLFIVLERDGKIIATGAYKPLTNAPRKSNASGRTKPCVSRGLPARGAGAGAQGGAGRIQPNLPDNRLSPAGSGRLYLSQGYQAQFDLNRDPEEYSQPPFDGRLRFTKTLVREAFSKTA